MKQIMAIIRINKINATKKALNDAGITSFTATGRVLKLARPGTYRVALHYSPYLEAKGACVSETPDGMIGLQAGRSGVLKLAFTVTASHAIAAISGSRNSCP